MKAIDFLDYLCDLMLLLAMISSIIRFKEADTSSRLLCYLLCLSFLTEALAYFAAKRFHNNIPVYTVFSLFELMLTSLYFNYCIDIFYKYRIGVYIGIVGFILGVLNIIFLQSISRINSNFLFFEGIVIIAMAFTLFARLVMKHDTLRIKAYHHFWFAVILTFYWCSNFFNLSLYQQIIFAHKPIALLLNMLNFIVNIITYLSIAIVFLLYPKMQKQDE